MNRESARTESEPRAPAIIGRHDFDAALEVKTISDYAIKSGRVELEAKFAAIAQSLGQSLSQSLNLAVADAEAGHSEAPVDFLAPRCCPACGHDSDHVAVLVKYQIPIVECGGCGFCFASRMLTEKAADYTTRLDRISDDTHISFLTSDVYLNYGRKRYGYELQVIAAFVRPGSGRRLLDIGCSVGSFLEVAASHGWSGTGVEMVRASAEYARAKGYRVFHAPFPTDHLADDPPFDLVVTLDTLEHIPAPRDFVAQMAAVVAPGGLLFIQVPNISCLATRLRGAADNNYNGLIHLNYFSPQTLGAMVEPCGFRLLHAETVLSEYRHVRAFDDAAIDRALSDLGVPARAKSITPDVILDQGLGYKVVAVFERNAAA